MPLPAAKAAGRLVLAAAAALLVSCSSGGPDGVAVPADGPCAAVGRIRWSAAGRILDATAVAHFAPPSTLHLRLVDPAGRSAAEIRTDGRTVRLTRRDEATWWEGEGIGAVERLGGPSVSPADWVAILRGKSGAPPPWRSEAAGSGCFPESLLVEGVDAAGRETRIRFDWDAIEPWPEAERSLGPVPSGYRRVDEPPLGEKEGGR